MSLLTKDVNGVFKYLGHTFVWFANQHVQSLARYWSNSSSPFLGKVLHGSTCIQLCYVSYASTKPTLSTLVLCALAILCPFVLQAFVENPTRAPDHRNFRRFALLSAEMVAVGVELESETVELLVRSWEKMLNTNELLWIIMDPYAIYIYLIVMIFDMFFSFNILHRCDMMFIS